MLGVLQPLLVVGSSDGVTAICSLRGGGAFCGTLGEAVGIAKTVWTGFGGLGDAARRSGTWSRDAFTAAGADDTL